MSNTTTIQSTTPGLDQECLNQIIKLISTTPKGVCGIVAPTGSGKSTTLIKEIFRVVDEAKIPLRIFVSEPTIPAAQSLYLRMKTLMNRDDIGWAGGGEINYTSKHRLIYCTSGHLEERMLSCFEKSKVKEERIQFANIIIIDEAHNGSVSNDVIMELWNIAQKQNIIVPKLILTSATLEMKETLFYDAPTLEIKTKSFPINLQYHNDDYEEDSDEMYTELSKIIINKHKIQPLIQGKGDTWLVFCPGASEVEELKLKIEKGVDKTVEVIPFYSDINDGNSVIFSKPKPGIRRIVVSTNITETSITIEDLSGIFDTMFEKYTTLSQSGGSCLITSHITKSSAAQRMGRTGRTCPGFCYRMCTEQFHNTLPQQREREIKRIPLHDIVIKLIDVGLPVEDMFQRQLKKESLLQSINLLKDLDMINSRGSTEKGKFASSVPMSVRCSSVLWDWKTKTDWPLFPCISALSLIDAYGPSYYYYPRQHGKTYQESNNSRKEHYNEYFKRFEGSCHLESLLNMWVDMLSESLTDSEKYDKKLLYNWTTENSINRKKILECIRTVRLVSGVLRRGTSSKGMFDTYRVRKGVFGPQGCLYVLTPLLESSFKDHIFEEKNGKYIKPLSDGSEHILDTRIFFTENRTNPAKLICLAMNEIQTQKYGSRSSTRIISLAHPIGLKFTAPIKKAPVVHESKKKRHFGFAKYAYVTLVMLGDRYVPGAIVLGHSIRKNSQYLSEGIAELICMVTSDVSREAVDKLSLVFDYVKEVKYIEKECIPLQTNQQEILYGNWMNKAFTKWNCLGLAYQKVLFFDSDVIIVKPIDSLFEMSTPAGVFSLPWSSNYTGTTNREGEPVGLTDLYAPNGIVNTGDKVPDKLIFNALEGGKTFVCWATTILLPCSSELMSKFLEYINSSSEAYGYYCHSSYDEQAICEFLIQAGYNWSNIDRSYNFVPYKGKEAWQMPGKENSVLHYHGKEKPWEDTKGWADLIYWKNYAKSFEDEYGTKLIGKPKEKKEKKEKKKKKLETVEEEELLFDASGNAITSAGASGNIVDGQVYVPKIITKHTTSKMEVKNDTMGELYPMSTLINNFTTKSDIPSNSLDGKMEMNLYNARKRIDVLYLGSNSYEYNNIIDRMMINYINKDSNVFMKARSECAEKKIDSSAIDGAENILRNIFNEIPKEVSIPTYDRETQKVKVFLEKKYPNVSQFEIIKCALRYYSLGIRGQQWSLNKDSLKALKEKGYNTEAFASPFNNYFDRYYSIFNEDKPFGSLGSFFGADHTNEVIYANPPFTEYMLNKLVDEICSLQYVYIVTPDWNDAGWYERLKKCGFKVQSMTNVVYELLDDRFTPKFKTAFWTK